MGRELRIIAGSIEEALQQVARKFDVPTSSLAATVVSESDGRLTVQVREQTGGEPDSILEQLEKEVESIETDEILEGLTPEELKDRGIIGGKKVEVRRSKYSAVKQVAGYVFYEGVEYAFIEGKDIDDVNVDDVDYVKSVEKGQRIAWKKLDLNAQKLETFSPETLFTSGYLESARVIFTMEEDKLVVVSDLTGKVAVIKDLVYVVSAKADARCEVRVAMDKMSAEVDLFSARGGGKPLDVTMVETALKEAGVTFGIKSGVIAENVNVVELTGQAQFNVTVAEGIEPQDGAAARITLHFSEEPTVEDMRILPDGRVDYRKKANIQIVKKGDLLAEIGEPLPGKDGMDVCGTTLKGLAGDEKVLYAGENVKYDKENRSFYAECEGQPILNKNILNVMQHYFVPGDVDYSSGNISFKGNVTVKGSILPGFEVKATGDIVIMQNIESGMVEAGRDVKVHGGIIGGNDSIVKCGRDLHAHHLQNALVEVEGNVIVKNSIIHSEVFSTGDVFLREGKGTIVGGMISALRSIDVKIAGSPAGARTELVAGHDFLVQKTAKEFARAREFCANNIEKIEKYLKPLLAQVQSGKELAPEQKQRLAMVAKKHKELTSHLRMMEAKIKRVQQEATRNRNAVVKIAQSIYPDVKVTIRELHLVITDKCDHCRFTINPKKGTIEKGGY